MGLVRYFGLVSQKDDGKGVANVRVEAWDVDSVLPDAVAITTTGADGRFTLFLREADVDRLFGGRRPVVKFRVISGTLLLADTQDSHTWHLREHARGRIDVNTSLPIGTAPTPPRLAVRGTVMDANTGAMWGVSVSAFDRNVTAAGVTETLIGSTTTDSRGRYQISFDNRSLGVTSKEVPDIVVRATNGTTVLAERHACSALPITTVPLVVGGDVFHGRGEFAWLREMLDGRRGGVAWSALSTDQAELLACGGRAHRPSVDALIAAAQLASEVPAVPEEAFYGLLRHGLPSSRVLLLSHRPAHLRQTLAKAIAAGTVSHALEAQLDDIEDALLDAAVLAAFDPRPNGVGLGTLVSHTPSVSAANQQIFVQKVLEHTGDLGAFWFLVDQDQDLSQYSAALRFTVEVAPLVANHGPMIDELHALRATSELTRPDDLAKLLDSDWEDLVAITDVPPGTPGTNSTQKRANYAAWISRTAEARFRTARVADRITRAEPTADVTTFFTDNPNFRFEGTRVAKYLAEQPSALDNVPANNRPAAIARLKKLERLFRVTTTYEQMAALDDAGLTSAHAMYLKGKKRFVTDHAATLGGEEAAVQVFLKASWAVAAGSALLGKYSSKVQVNAKVLPDYKSPPPAPPPEVADWESLFGTLDACACDHCQSVFGPSAYLVDLLQFLDRQPAGASTGRDLLFEKRPDIERLELSCQTSDTPLPYVDLVNEAIEIALLAEQEPPVAGPTDTAKTMGTAEDLLAEPDELYPGHHIQAGNVLANAVYPFEVPFHFWDEKARIYLRHLGLPRWELMAALDPAQQPFAGAIVTERLGISPRQKAIIEGASLQGVTLENLWGYATGAPAFPAELSNLVAFLKRARLSYDDVLELVATGAYPLTIPEDAGCDLSQINWGMPSTGTLTQLHRFLRLRPALGWSITDLGKAVTALGSIDELFLQKIAVIQALRQRLDLEIPSLLSFFADIDRNGAFAPSLFERLFLARTVAQPEDAPFRTVFETGSAAGEPLSAHKQAILVSVGATAADLDLVTNANASESRLALPPAIDEAANLSLAALSAIHRTFALAKAARLSVGDFRVLAALSTDAALAATPFQTPQTTFTFLDVADRVRQSGLSVPEVHYLLRHVTAPGDTVAPSAARIDEVLVEILSAAARANQDATKSDDPAGSQVEPLLRALVSDQAQVDTLIDILDGGTGLSRPARLALVATHLGPLVLDLVDVQHKVVGLVDDDPDYLPTRAERYAYLDLRLLHHTAAAAAVKQVLGETLALAAPIVQRLAATRVLPSAAVSGCGALADFLHDFDPDPAVVAAARRAHLVRLHKAALLVRRLRLRPEEFLVLYLETGEASSGQLPWLDLAALPISAPNAGNPPSEVPAAFFQLIRLMDLAALRDRWPGGSEGLFHLLDLAMTAQIPDLQDEVAKQTSCSADDVAAITQHLALAIAAFKNGDAILSLDRALAAVRKLGVAAASAIAWTDLEAPLPDPNPANPQGVRALARDIQRAARAKYTAEAWSSVARPLRDVLRERHRAALVACLMVERGHEHAAQLYEDLLIDVEMSPCMLTSRTVQAAAAAQLLVQRALLRLEGDFLLDEDAAREWEWMKSYRVWEANRKVFLYPENWIEPELRDDKTPLFRDFENKLSHGPLTSETAERALQGYLEGLHEIANLDVVAMAEEREEDPDQGMIANISPPRHILHIFGRTSEPHVYYYRTYREGRFSPWEKMDLDLPDGHLVPVVHNRRLHLFWPELLEKSPGNAGGMKTMVNDGVKIELDESGEPVNPGAGPAGNEDAVDKPILWPGSKKPGASSEEQPPKRLFLTLAYSEYKSGRWTKKRVAKEAAVQVPIEVPPGEPTPPDFLDPVFFLARSSSSAIKIDACLWQGDDGPEAPYLAFAQFSFDPCSARSKAPEGFDTETLAIPPSTTPLLQVFKGDGAVVLATDTDEDDIWNETIFAETPDDYALVAPRASEPRVVRDRLFYKDGKRTFLLERRTEKVVEALPMSKYMVIQSINGAIIETEETTGTHVFEDGTYRARVFYHPYACSFLKTIAQHGVDGLLRWARQSSPKVQLQHASVESAYSPNVQAIETPLPVEDVDFSAGGAYSAYNWEVFFHAPFLVATRLDAEQRYEEADRWYRYMFDPIDGSNEEAPARFWKVRPFHENKDLADMLEELTTLAAGEYNMHLWELSGLAGNKPKTQASGDLAAQIAAWRKDPFNPHAIARMRPLAYQKQIVMRYVDHLLSWGDHLFRMDTRESVAEATQLYVYAREILGDRPVLIDKAHPPVPKTYGDLVAIDAFGNALVDVEAIAPPPPEWGSGPGDGAPPPEGVWGTLYFCLPPNEKLLRYWDIVDDRLFKIRCCMNIEGVRRDLPLFEPPIDPALLVKARAAGVDIASVLADLNQGAPIYRFSVLCSRAVEFAGYVSSLGAGLLSALEKRDAEHLAVLRNTHEIRLAQTTRQLKKRQIDEAKEQVVALERSRAVVDERRVFYANIPKRISPERAQITGIDWATGFQVAAQAAAAVAVALTAIPATKSTAYTTPPGTATQVEIPATGDWWSRTANMVSSGLHAASYIASQEATKSGIEAGYQRREADWRLQKDLAEREIAQIDKQIAAARIRVAIAEGDLEAHDQAIEQAREVEAFFRDKYTNEELYDWLIGRSSSLHYEAYKLAYQMARRAEKAYQLERGDEDDSFIRFDAWDSARSGLLAGERLLLDLRRLEAAYLERNRREYEITKHVSLAAHAPRELLRLREEGAATVHLKEAHFDQDHPTHYLRRLKAVTLSVPCVTGPYQGVNAKLTLLGGETRKSPVGNDIAVSRGAVQSIVTSTGQNDGGQFELVFRDDRYLPFEGVGAHRADTPQWDLTLARATNRFRFDTIADAILHVRYTARDGRVASNPTSFTGACLFSAKADFPDAWRAFQDSESEKLVLPFAAALFCRPESMPVVKLKKVSFYTKRTDGQSVSPTMALDPPSAVTLTGGAAIGALVCWDNSAPIDEPAAEWKLVVTSATHAALADIWIAVDYQATTT